jgi:hypothetical protein
MIRAFFVWAECRFDEVDSLFLVDRELCVDDRRKYFP